MLRNHEFFCEVDPAFVQDRFNLYGLKEVVGPLYGEAMTMILGYAPTGARASTHHQMPWLPSPRGQHRKLTHASAPNCSFAEKQLADPTQRVHKVRFSMLACLSAATLAIAYTACEPGRIAARETCWGEVLTVPYMVRLCPSRFLTPHAFSTASSTRATS